jgi:hypothetical protein
MHRSLALASIVTLFGLFVAMVVSLAYIDKLDASSTPLIVTLLGLLTTTIPSLVALAKIEDVKKDVENGRISDTANKMLKRYLEDYTEAIKQATNPQRGTRNKEPKNKDQPGC